MGLLDKFGSVMELAKENPVLAGVITFGVYMFLKHVFGGDKRGVFNRMGSTAKVGGAGLAFYIASAMLSDEAIGQPMPDFVKDFFDKFDEEPEPEPEAP